MNNKRLNIFIVLFFSIYAFVLFYNNGTISLWDQDEAAYAAFGKQMLYSRDYLIPHYVWSKIHRKPPLHFWLIALSYRIFGVNEFAVRFWTSISILLSVLIIFLSVRKLFDKKTAFFSSIIFATNFFVILLAKIALTDALLLLFYSITGFSLIFFIGTQKKLYLLFFWTAIALALLVKGPPIVIFAGMFFILGLIFLNERKYVFKLHPWIYGILALMPLFWWGYMAWQADNGKFIRWLIDWYILKRVNSYVLGQTGPPGYYLLTFVVFFLPFFPFLFDVFKNSFVSLKNKEQPYIFFALWLISGWFIYEFLKSKLPSYAIAAYPAISVMIAVEINKLLSEGKINLPLKIGQIVKNLILFLFVILFFYYKNLYSLSFAFGLFFLLWLVLSIAESLFLFFGHKGKYITSLFTEAIVISFVAFIFLYPKVDKMKNAPKRTAIYIKEVKDDAKAVVIENDFGRPPSLPFYIETISKLPYKVEHQCDSIVKLYNSEEKYIFILDSLCFEKLKDSIIITNYKSISSYSPDRKGQRNYIIVRNFK